VSDVDVRGASLLDVAWKDYRGWAAAARAHQSTSRRQAILVLVITSTAALFGALASIHWPDDGFILVASSLAAAILVGIGTVLGRYILDVNAQQQWIQARATAESIKSECYRYAARCAEYANRDAALRFKNRIEALSAAATSKGLFADAQARAAARPGPAIGITADWYRTHRLIEQRDWYQKRSGEHASTAQLLRRIGFALGSVAAALGVVSAAHLVSWIAPFVAMMTTVTTSVVAYGALGRQVYLAASYSAMASQIDRLAALNSEGDLPDDKLVEAGEDLLSSEHRGWADRVAQQGTQERRSTGSRRPRTSTAV
jgi:hypothetical protein